MKTVSSSRNFFAEANVHTGVLEHTAIPLDIIIFLTHAG